MSLSIAFLLGVMATPGAAGEHTTYDLTIARACQTRVEETCVNLETQQNLQMTIASRADDGALSVEGLAPIYMQTTSSNRDELELTYSGKATAGVTHHVTLIALGIFRYAQYLPGGDTNYLRGYLEKSK